MANIKRSPTANITSEDDAEAAARAQESMDKHARNHATKEANRIQGTVFAASVLQREMGWENLPELASGVAGSRYHCPWASWARSGGESRPGTSARIALPAG
jgi:hypothetical protein